jgi:YggT family protein
MFLQLNIVHFIVHLFFSLLIVFLLARVIISWIPVGVENPIVRFIINLTAPLLEPMQKRLPRMIVWMFDLNLMIAFIFVWWVIGKLDFLIQSGLPVGW